MQGREFPPAGLTPKQKKLLDFIAEFSALRGYAPSQQEIAKQFRFKSLGTVQNYLVRLERHGLLQKTWNARRGMQIVTPQPQTLEAEALARSHAAAMAQRLGASGGSAAVPLPLLGRVAAGRPIEAVTTDETIDVPPNMIRRGEHFVLRVVGDSMIDDGILDGDYAVIQKRADAENGQTVVALVNNEATIKKYYRRGGRVELHPANPNYKPIIVTDGEFHIEGVLAGVLRVLK